MSHASRWEPSRRRVLTESAAILVGTAINGLGAYAYIAVGTRTYGDVAMAPVAVLWTFWAVSVAVFMFPLQHWAIRQISIDGDTSGVGGTVPRIGLLVVGLALAGGIAGFVWSEQLFGTDDMRWSVWLTLVTAGSALSGLQRGVLSGLGRYYATAANIAAESILRLAVGLVVAVLVDDVVWFAATLVIGPAVAVLWPETFRLPVRSGRRLPVFGFLGGIAGGILVAQVILNAGPVVLQSVGGRADAVTALFLALALFRAPYLLALGGATRVTAPLTRLMMSDDMDRVRRLTTVVALATVGGAAVAYPVARALGPPVIKLFFAPQSPVAPGPAAAIAAGCVLALGCLGLILMLMASGRATAVQLAMIVALVAAAVTLATWPGSALDSVVASFVVAELVAILAVSTVLLSGSTLRGSVGSR